MNMPPLPKSLILPALHAPGGSVRKEEAADGSYWGGTPCVPEGWAWPRRHDDTALSFLGCLDLAQVQEMLPTPWLPDAGTLLFFYDVEDQPWGFSDTDRDGWRVEYVPAGTCTREHPGAGQAYARRPMLFSPIETYPEGIPPLPGGDDLDDEALEKLADQTTQRNFGKLPHHQVGGYPDCIQNNDMEHECELVSRGGYAGTAQAYQEGKTLLSESDTHQWRLLLQVDTDETILGSEWMWGDCGMLYFWIREQDARQGQFENTWLVLQCF